MLLCEVLNKWQKTPIFLSKKDDLYLITMKIKTKKIIIDLNPNEGIIDIYRISPYELIVKNINMSLMDSEDQIFSTNNCKFTISQGPYEGNLGKGHIYRIDFDNSNSQYRFQLEIIHYKNYPFFTFEGIFTNISDQKKNIGYISPLSVLSSLEGGVFLTKTPEQSIIFENGLGAAFEFFTRSFNAAEESQSSLMQLVYNKNDLSQNLFLGILSLPEANCEIISNDEEDEGFIFEGKEGVAEWRAQQYFPFPKPLFARECMTTGVWILNLDSTDCFTALEDYANLIAKFNRLKKWEHDIPHGWNSWNNPLENYRDYSYITNINEKIILDNLEVAVRYLKRFGLRYWQLDNGYSPNKVMTVDDIMEDRFPNGMEYIAKKIREKDLIPGIWINPFNVGIESSIFKKYEKEGWFPEPDPSFPVKDNTWRPIDLSIPKAQQFLRKCIRKVVKEWGFKLLKVDFAYLNMSPTNFYDESMTSAEIHKLGWIILREEAGDDVFIYGIGGPIGLHYGFINGERITLDTIPEWHPSNMPIEMLDIPQTNGSLFYNYRTMARKYFYNNRVWFNHLDCFSFRPSLAENEAMMLITATAFLGGIWKIGDKLVDMSPKHFDIISKMLPIHKNLTRPIDLFRRLIPEIMHFKYEKDEIEQNVVALMNWGPNRDIISGEDIPSGKKTITINFEEIGLNPTQSYHVFDFWNQKYLGIYEKMYEIELEERHQQTLAIIRDEKCPQFISSNRHFTQGQYTFSKYTKFDFNSNSICGIIRIVPNFEHNLFFTFPKLMKMKSLKIDSVENFSTNFEENLLKISFQIQKESHETIESNFEVEFK